MSYSDELRQLDEIAKRIFSTGSVKNISVTTCSGYTVQISAEKYCEIVKGGQNPITLIVNATANATATSSVSVSQKIQNIIHDVEKSGVNPKKLSEAKTKLNTLESELNKPAPDEKVIKKIVNWASEFSLELFARIAVLIAERFLKPM